MGCFNLVTVTHRSFVTRKVLRVAWSPDLLGFLHNPLVGFTKGERKGRSNIVSYSSLLCEMGHSTAIWDYRAANEITADCNGNLQVVLRNPQGASARVSLFVSFAFFVGPGILFHVKLILVL